MLNFFKRLGRAVADILTSKKAIATIGGAIATAAGVPAPVVAAVVGPYVVGQGIADSGKERAKKEAQLEAARARPPTVHPGFLAASARDGAVTGER